MSSCGAVCEIWEFERQADDDVWQSHTENPELTIEIDRVASMIDESDELDEATATFAKEALDRAETFLSVQSDRMREENNELLPIPSIDIGPGGSIDLHWKRASWELLVNIPAARTKRPAAYYGDDYGLQTGKGNFDPRHFSSGIAAWLKHK